MPDNKKRKYVFHKTYAVIVIFKGREPRMYDYMTKREARQLYEKFLFHSDAVRVELIRRMVAWKDGSDIDLARL